MSVARAIVIGLLWVNGPVLALLIAPFVIMGAGNSYGFIPRAQNWIILPLFAGGFVLAWLWWSLMIPKWRLWAYERVTDIPRLKAAAVNVGLTWPDGSAFSCTEIKSREQTLRERQLDPEPPDDDDD
jgi:hypothetical protein